MNALTVFLNEHATGELVEDDDGLLRFTYAPEWLKRGDATPLSRMLPLQTEPFEGKRARPFFAGILPEEGPRTRIAEILGITERNDFAMLKKLGGECAGAVSLLPAGEVLGPVEYRLRILDDSELASVISELPDRPLMAGEKGVRLSLAGAQDKLPVVLDGDTIALPLGNTPSTHIIKPEPDRFPGLAANELFCMTLAREVDLDVPGLSFRKIGGKPCIVVARYDRRATHGMTTRVHQEDFCQALGRPPERKYQQEGGPTVRECVTLLREWSTTPVLDIRAFVDGLILNLLIGNADAHGKNYSMIYPAGQRRLAPCYDLVSTIAWPHLATRLAMNIGGGQQVSDLNLAHFRSMAEKCALGWPMVRERIASMANNVTNVINRGELVMRSPYPEIASHLADLITQRCQSITP